MRKKTQIKDDDSLLDTASKIINTLIGMEPIITPIPEYSIHNMRRYVNNGMPVGHIHKREISTEGLSENNDGENGKKWSPVFIIKYNSSINGPMITKNNHEKQSERKTESNEKIHSSFHENYGKFTYQSEKTDGNKADVIRKLQLEVNEMKRNNSVGEKISNSSFRSRNTNEYDLNLKHSKDLTSSEENDINSDLFDYENSDFGVKDGIKIIQKLFMNCKRKTKSFDENRSFILSMQSCIQVSVLRALDRMLLSQVIPLNEDVYLVRDVNSSLIKNTSQVWNPSAKDLKGTNDFIAAVGERMFRMLQSHSLQIKLWHSPDDIVEGRRRHHYRKAFPMMVAGYMIMSAFLVPLGFQFMAMIGGKALLLSKMALMMSMLGGFRKLLHPEPVYHPVPSYDFHGNAGWHHRSTHEPMTLAYSKNNYGGYNSLQRDLHHTQHWIDPKSYTELK